MARRLTKGGHQCVVFDRNRENVNTLAKEGPAPAYSLEELGLPHILENTSDELSPRTTKPRTRKNITMKRIRTLKPVGLPRFVYALIVCAPLVATLGVGSVMAADNNAKITLVYEHALPNVRAKVSRVCSSNMVPEVHRQPTRIPSQLSSTQPFSRERSEVRSMMVRSLSIAPGRASPRCPVTGTALVRTRARPNPPSCWPCSWSIRTKRN